MLILYWVSVKSVYHRLSWHQAIEDIEWWNILIHIFVIIHFAPLFMWEWPNILLLYVTIFQRVRRQKAIIVKLPKVIVITELTKQIRRNTNMLLYLKQSSLSVSELIKMIMWSYLCELSSLVKIFCEESGPDLRRQSDEWKTGPSQKHFRLSYQRNCEQRRGPEESVSIEPEWWHLGLAKQSH